jgi:glutamate dehydrogenase/leucine dehydrogenase
MQRAFNEVLEEAEKHKLPMRRAANVLAVKRVAAATRARGLYP